MARRFFNKKDLAVPLTTAQIKLLEEKRERLSAMGEQAQYDVFLSHSTEDMEQIKKLRDWLECNCDISVYIDWDEDEGTPRDEIADVVKDAMNRSKTFLIVKTDNSDDSSWVPWETGYFDKKDCERIGVLLVEDEDSKFNHETFKHREFLKNYIILGPEDIVEFIKHGSSYIKEKIDSNKPPFVVIKPKKNVEHNKNKQRILEPSEIKERPKPDGPEQTY